MIETRLRGIPFWVHDDEDLSNAIRRNRDFWEGDLLDYVVQNFPIQNVVLDIGANIGNHTVFLATYLSEYSKIVAFEPIHENFELLRKNISRFEQSKVFAYEQGMSDHPDWVTLIKNTSNLGASEVSETAIDAPGTERVFANTVDEISHWFHPVTLMKIDVEWWEPQVIEGAKETINKDKPLIIIEDTKRTYGSLLPQYDMIMAWEHHNTYLYKWRE